ncbi:MAG: SPOR domain-containing protein [Marinilabiliales bacterium]|nr:SPOR domain-containing protein [Marinilabiliales bacterium]
MKLSLTGSWRQRLRRRARHPWENRLRRKLWHSQEQSLSRQLLYHQKLLPHQKQKLPRTPEAVYYLIVASFRDIDQAQLVAEKYTNDYKADIIILSPTPQGYYRISYGCYSTPEEAGATLPAVRETVNPDAWVYSMKKPR